MADITFDLSTSDGKSAEQLAEIIARRTKELGQTTSQACTAMAINILKSLRADTAIAKLNKGEIRITCVDGQVTPGWRKEGKRNFRVLRYGLNGAEVRDKMVYFVKMSYTKGEIVHAYFVEDVRSDDKKYQYYIVAKSENIATKFAENKHKNRVKRFKGLAKHALGIAMHRTSAAQTVSETGIEPTAKNKAMEVVKVQRTESGYDSGEVMIHIEDQLRYAVLALKNGQQNLDYIVDRVIKSMTGYLQRKLDGTKPQDSKVINTQNLNL